MFSSVSHEEDDNIFLATKNNNKRKENQQRKKGEKNFTLFPLDCIGEILSYNQSVSVLKKVIGLSKDVQKFIETENSTCCMNVVFRFILKPCRKLHYVRKLVVEKSLIFNSSVFKLFPDIEDLCLVSVRCHWILLKSAPKLRKLSIQSCSKMATGNSYFHGCSDNLEVLKIDFSHLVGKRLFNTESLLTLPNLRKLELCQITLSHYNPEHFKNLKNLTVLRMKNVEKIDSSFFTYTPNLEVIDLEKCKNFKCDSFSSLSVEKLDEVRIVNCSNITREKLLKVFGGKEPKSFELVNPKIVDNNVLTEDERDELMRMLKSSMTAGRMHAGSNEDDDDDDSGWSDEEEEKWD